MSEKNKELNKEDLEQINGGGSEPDTNSNADVSIEENTNGKQEEKVGAIWIGG